MNRTARRAILIVFLILVFISIATLIFTVFAIPENSAGSASSLIPAIPDIDDPEHLISMTSDDGYVKITIYNEPSPADSEGNSVCYYMHIWIDWLKTPVCRGTDSLLIQYPSFALANSEEQYSIMTYTTTALSGKRTEHHIEQKHNFWDWNLPNSTPFQRVSDIRIYARVKLYVARPTLHQILQTYVSYTHQKSYVQNGWLSDNVTYSLLSPMIEYIPETKNKTE